MVAEERGPLDRYDAGPLHLAVLSSRVCWPEGRANRIAGIGDGVRVPGLEN